MFFRIFLTFASFSLWLLFLYFYIFSFSVSIISIFFDIFLFIFLFLHVISFHVIFCNCSEPSRFSCKSVNHACMNEHFYMEIYLADTPHRRNAQHFGGWLWTVTIFFTFWTQISIPPPPVSSAWNTKRWIEYLCQWVLKTPTDRPRSDCVHEIS